MTPLHSFTTSAGATLGQTRTNSMDMIGLNRQLDDLPSLLGTFLFNQPPTVYGNRILQHSLAALGRPDKVVEDEMDSVFVALVLHRPALQLLISRLTV